MHRWLRRVRRLPGSLGAERRGTGTVQHLRAQHILVRTCDSFGLLANYLRLAVKTDAENDLLMAALDKENFDAR